MSNAASNMSDDFRNAIHPPLPTAELAKIYQVNPRQIRAWRAAGMPFMYPLDMRDALARQHRLGSAGKMLLRPGVAEKLHEEIESRFFTQ